MKTNNSENIRTAGGSKKTGLAEQFLTALRSRDWNLLHSIMAEDVVWSLPGNSSISGEAQGVEAVVSRAQTIISHGMTFKLKHILTGQHGVALSLHNTAQHGGVVFDAHLASVFSFRNGKIAAINTYFSDVEMVNAFFIPV